MITILEYALLAADIYCNSPSVRLSKNNWPVPDGWMTMDIAPTDSTSTGFMARAYQRGNEIVIAYAGTTDENMLDWLIGNGPAATAIVLTPQILEAAKFYLDVRRANPGASISFAGHSLGGGFASLMAVYFDRPASVFDEAPFLKSADSGAAVVQLKLALIHIGYILPPELINYQTSIESGVRWDEAIKNEATVEILI